MRMNYKMLLLALFIWAIPFTGSAQSDLVFHTDRPYYITGETAWYQLYLPASFHRHQISLRTVITDSDGLIIDELFLKTNGETSVEGYYAIPFTLASGVYQINFFVSKTLGQDELVLASFDLHIYNDINPGQASTGNRGSSNINELQLDDLSVTIQTGSMEYHARDEVRMVVNVTDGSGSPVSADLSISVVDENLIGTEGSNQMIQTRSFSGDVNPSSLDNVIYHKGRMTGDSGEPLQGNVIGAYSPTQYQMFYTKSDADGDFILSLPDYQGSKPIQMIGYIFEEHASINIDFNDKLDVNPQSALTYGDHVMTYLEESRKRKKIYQYYKKSEAYLSLQEVVAQVKELEPNGTFNVKEYEDFKNIAEFFNELINSQLDFPKNRDDVYSARMYNPEARGNIRHFTGDPIFIIDGKITRDADFIGKMNLEPIETVDLYFLTNSIRDDFGTFGNSAFVFINTNLPSVQIPEEEEEDIFTVKGIQIPGKFGDVSEEEVEGTTPLFRPVVFWSQNLSTDSNGRAQISFRHSDDVSRFRITVMARNVSGQVGLGQGHYDVSLEK